MFDYLTVILIYLLIVLVPMLAGYGVMEILHRRRGSEPADYGPWKVMAALSIIPTLLMISALIWTSFLQVDYAEFKGPTSVRAMIINALSFATFLMPGAYLGALVTGLVKGVTRKRAYIWLFGLLAPFLFAGWYFLVLALSCVTTGACL